MLKNKTRILAVMMAFAILLTGCVASPENSSVPVTGSTPAASVSTEASVDETEAPADTEASAVETDAPTGEPSGNAEESAASDAPDSGDTPVSTSDSDNGYKYHRATPEERRYGKMQMFLKYCSTQATVETNVLACVVDVRTAENPYDVDWDYGLDYNRIVSYTDWSLVFDAEYYMEQFPMLAYQYHYDKDLRIRHFQTVGVHEGRQGNAGFNVADYMAKCAPDARELYGDCYAAYYFHFMNIETDRSMDVSGNGQPRQMTAVLTIMQAKELRQINKLRESLGVESLVFDSELAAMGNFRGWVDAAEDWPMHDWLKAHREEAYQMMVSFGSIYAGENTVKHYGPTPNNWYYNYYNSKDHYDAMVDPKNAYIGCSNAYLGSCEHKPSGIVLVEFDMFSYDIGTALNPKQ